MDFLTNLPEGFSEEAWLGEFGDEGANPTLRFGETAIPQLKTRIRVKWDGKKQWWVATTPENCREYAEKSLTRLLKNLLEWGLIL